MSDLIFNTLEELLRRARRDKACAEGLEWLQGQPDLQTALECCPPSYRVWALCKRYDQFIEHCDWTKLTGEDWAYLLRDRPKFAEHCDWAKLDGLDWVCLLDHPEFAERCDWSKLTGWDWCLLFRDHPEFAERCDWTKLSEEDWSWLLRRRRRFAKYRGGVNV